mmetsp:Transcript_53407/g.169851  ORF Transcript_53407/g.169851 Transcript_53407/m.169851 type:complete len:228 (-) Transcript_53407:756-1439(-)
MRSAGLAAGGTRSSLERNSTIAFMACCSDRPLRGFLRRQREDSRLSLSDLCIPRGSSKVSSYLISASDAHRWIALLPPAPCCSRAPVVLGASAGASLPSPQPPARRFRGVLWPFAGCSGCCPPCPPPLRVWRGRAVFLLDVPPSRSSCGDSLFAVALVALLSPVSISPPLLLLSMSFSTSRASSPSSPTSPDLPTLLPAESFWRSPPRMTSPMAPTPTLVPLLSSSP